MSTSQSSPVNSRFTVGVRAAAAALAAALCACGWTARDHRDFERVCAPEFGDAMCACMAPALEKAKLRPSDLGTSLLAPAQPPATAKAVDAAIEACASASKEWPAVYRSRVREACGAEGYPPKFCDCLLAGIERKEPWPQSLAKLARGKQLAIDDSPEFEQECMPFAGDRWWPGAIQGAVAGCLEQGRSENECNCVARSMSERVPFPLFLQYADAKAKGRKPSQEAVEAIQRAVADCAPAAQ